MKLYDYYRSTACYRVRIALHLKNIPFELEEVHLVNAGGEQHSLAYQQINPQQLVPSLEVNGLILTQSLAIIEYLDLLYPKPSLFPDDPFLNAKVRALALIIACDMHPLNNLRVLNQLKHQFKADETEVKKWYHHWLQAGFDAFERQLMTLERGSALCCGDRVSLADVCLIPQVYNARRYDFPLENYPLINEINTYCLGLEAFKKAGVSN